MIMNQLQRAIAASVCLSLAALLSGCGQNAETAANQEAPSADSGEMAQSAAIPGRYIVVFDRDFAQVRRDGFVFTQDGQLVELVRFVNELVLADVSNIVLGPFLAINGILIETLEGLAEAISQTRGVAYVEPDRIVRVDPQFGSGDSAANWGLDRIDQRALPLDGRFIPNGDGAGSHLYILDTGLRTTHSEFSGRVAGGRNFVAEGPGGLPLPLLGLDLGGLLGGLLGTGGGNTDTENFNDCNGHGTHVAGSAAGTRFGVAPLARIHALRVFGCSGAGSTSTIIAALDWMIENAQTPAIANLSLGGGNSQALDDAVDAAIDAGITVVTASGNSNADACTGSPNRVPRAITVGATARNDSRSGFSNHGSCVDLMAPGSGILSAWHTGDDATRELSGTSMASPHVAGAAALVTSTFPEASPAAVANALQQAASRPGLGDLRGSPDRMLFVGN